MTFSDLMSIAAGQEAGGRSPVIDFFAAPAMDEPEGPASDSGRDDAFASLLALVSGGAPVAPSAAPAPIAVSATARPVSWPMPPAGPPAEVLFTYSLRVARENAAAPPESQQGVQPAEFWTRAVDAGIASVPDGGARADVAPAPSLPAAGAVQPAAAVPAAGLESGDTDRHVLVHSSPAAIDPAPEPPQADGPWASHQTRGRAAHPKEPSPRADAWTEPVAQALPTGEPIEPAAVEPTQFHSVNVQGDGPQAPATPVDTPAAAAPTAAPTTAAPVTAPTTAAPVTAPTTPAPATPTGATAAVPPSAPDVASAPSPREPASDRAPQPSDTGQVPVGAAGRWTVPGPAVGIAETSAPPAVSDVSGVEAPVAGGVTPSGQFHGELGRGFADDDRSREEPLARGRTAMAASRSMPDTVPVFSDLPMPAAVLEPAAPVEAVPPSGLDLPDTADLLPQVVRSVSLQSLGETGHARIHLRPENLGDIVVDLRVSQGDVIASMRADVPAVREWIESRAQELRSALGVHGLELVHLSVNERDGGRREPEPQRQAPRPKTKYRNDDVFDLRAASGT